MDSKNKLLLVVNPISGGSEKETLIEEIKKELDHYNVALQTYRTTGSDDDHKIRKIIDAKAITKVLVAGGDGTIQIVAKAIKERDVAVALIPAGSANGLASNFNLPNTVAAQVDIAMGTHFIMMDMLSINDHLSLHIADIGINAALIENYENSAIRGKLGYALQTIPTLLASDLPYDFSIALNGKTIKIKGVMIAIANANQFGTGAIINPDGEMDDGQFEVLIFKNLGVYDILKTLNKTAKRDPDFVESYATKKALITCDKEVSFQVDGEYIGNVKEVFAELLSSKLKIMIPKT